MSYNLGNNVYTKKLTVEQLGTADHPVDNAYITNIIPPPGGGGAGNLQEVLDNGNSATQEIVLDGEYYMGTPSDPQRAGMRRLDIGAGTNVIFRHKDDLGLLRDHLVLEADETTAVRHLRIRSTFGNEVRLGTFSTADPVGDQSINIGTNVGVTSGTTQNQKGVNIGVDAGLEDAGDRAICIGDQAGQGGGIQGVGDDAIAIGQQTLEAGSGPNTIAIGKQAGQGTSSTAGVAIGAFAGQTQLGNNSIVLNASGADRSTTTSGQLIIDPVRNLEKSYNDTRTIFYDDTTKEVFYDIPRYSITNYTGGPGTTTSLSTDPPTVVYCQWVAGPGTWTVILPYLAQVAAGTRIKIKNGGTVAGQNVVVQPFAVPPVIQNQIDLSPTSATLPAAPRTTTGGGGSCIELVAKDSVTWFVVGGYNGTY